MNCRKKLLLSGVVFLGQLSLIAMDDEESIRSVLNARSNPFVQMQEKINLKAELAFMKLPGYVQEDQTTALELLNLARNEYMGNQFLDYRVVVEILVNRYRQIVAARE